MLTIRDTQLQIWGERFVTHFERHLAEHLLACFPAVAATLSEAALTRTCRAAITGAARYGIEAERDICKYLNLMCVFGRTFDEDPRFPWAARILADPRIGPTLKTNRLYLEALEHEAEGVGLDGHAVVRGPEGHR